MRLCALGLMAVLVCGGTVSAEDRAKKLSAAGFEESDISEALTWLAGVVRGPRSLAPLPSSGAAFRAYAPKELAKLDTECRGLLIHFEQAGILAPHMREHVIERALAATGESLTLMECQGSGTVYIANLANEINLVQLNNEKMWVEASNLVALDMSLRTDQQFNGLRGSATGTLVNGGLCDSVGSWGGRVVLCERGVISFYDKVNNVRLGGGVAAVIYNNVAGDLLGTLDPNTSTIIGIGITQADGQFLVANRLNQSATVNSVHHQGIKDLAKDFVVEAMSPDDGVVEAFRWNGPSYVAAVQWHPEFHDWQRADLLSGDPLLHDFLQATRTTRPERIGV